MAKLTHVLIYLLEKYPTPSELSIGRLTKLVYLADWRHSIERGSQVTNIEWVYNHYGPYVDDVRDTIEANSHLFDLRETATSTGNKKYQPVLLAQSNERMSFQRSEIEALRHAISVTHELSWSRFIKLVYSTYPMLKVEQYAEMDLPELAAEYEVFRERERGVAEVAR